MCRLLVLNLFSNVSIMHMLENPRDSLPETASIINSFDWRLNNYVRKLQLIRLFTILKKPNYT